MNTTRHIRNGLGAVRPYVYGPPGLLGFVQETFAAEVVEHSPDGGEVEVRIGDSAIALGLGEAFPQDRATTTIVTPHDEAYGERIGAVRDALGKRLVHLHLSRRTMNATTLPVEHLERLRAICLSLPDATEKETWGDPTWRVRNRIFAMQKGNYEGGRPPSG